MGLPKARRPLTNSKMESEKMSSLPVDDLDALIGALGLKAA
jgi:hypothetical protein